jgi:DNA-directed RNA polymerase specialized sigma24 family protein
MTREQSIERATVRYNGLLRAVASRWRGPLPFEDAYESAVTGLIRAVDTYDQERGSLSSWIYLHARRAVQTDALLYRQPDTVQYIDDCTAPISDDPAPTHGHLLRLLLNICGVNGNAADLLTECVLCNQSPSEAADTLGLSERSARAIYGNAVRVLKRRVTSEHTTESVLPEQETNE